MDVGVRELKRRLSEYLTRAAGGEVIRVTDRGRPKAMLVPLPEGPSLEEGVAEGWIRPAVDAQPKPVARQVSRRRVVEVLREDREG